MKALNKVQYKRLLLKPRLHGIVDSLCYDTLRHQRSQRQMFDFMGV